MQHAWELDIDGEARGAGHLGAAVDARHPLADERKLIVRRQRRRLAWRNLALDFTDGNVGDAEREFVAPTGFSWRHGQPLSALAASVAANTFG